MQLSPPPHKAIANVPDQGCQKYHDVVCQSSNGQQVQILVSEQLIYCNGSIVQYMSYLKEKAKNQIMETFWIKEPSTGKSPKLPLLLLLLCW
jgi:hypothetical protein